MIYLGEYNSPESRQKWAEVVTDWSAGNLDKYGSAVSVARLAVAYTKHAQNYYRKDGKRTSEACRVGSALKFLVAECWDLQTDKFTPKHLERVRNRMIPEETLPERHQRLHFDHHPGVQIWCRRRMCPTLSGCP
ncbi:MAG: hypothetical protein R3C12_06460 [Planctomycetaceae bacterium]